MNMRLISTLFFLQALPVFGAVQSEASGITATGACLKKITQDRASLILTSSFLSSSASQASNEATKVHQKLREAVQKLKLQNMGLETTNYSVGEEREWVNKKMVSKGFRARISLQVETSDIARMGEVIAAAANIGIKDIDSLSTFVSAEKYKSEYESCLEVASHNAKDKALKLAKGAGVKLGKVKSISEGALATPHSVAVRPMVMAKSMGGAELGSSPDEGPTIDTKSVDLNVSATVTFDAD